MTESVLGAGPLGLLYLLSAVLFVLALGGLSDQSTARRGNAFGIAGMIIAFVATLSLASPVAIPVLFLGLLIGGAIGAIMALRVEMTAMPEMVALLHSFVGLAAVLVGVSQVLNGNDHEGAALIVHRVEVLIDVIIGMITFTGSVIAFLKLRGTLSGNLRLPGRNIWNIVFATAALAMLITFGIGFEAMLWPAIALAAIVGVVLIHGIGSADMPVAVSLLNSYSGWTAAAAGFVLDNDALIVTGALVGSSGAILSYVMCAAMNRSIWNVVFGEIPADHGGSGLDPALQAAVDRGVNASTAEEAAEMLDGLSEVIIVPGYGMAVAQAQGACRELAELLEGKGARVRYAIHPVAGRLPGHMNVLLAEANVPYDVVLEMDEINADFPSTDAVIVLGANDIVNPSALEDPKSPLYGMPTLEVHKAKTVYVVKRSLAAGYSGVDNPLYYKPNTVMVFGDAKKVLEHMVRRLKHG